MNWHAKSYIKYFSRIQWSQEKNFCSLARFCINETEPEYPQIFYSNKKDTDFKTAESFERDKNKKKRENFQWTI
jgi:hypothetical protein